MPDYLSFYGIDVAAIDAQCLDPLMHGYGNIQILYFTYLLFGIQL